MRFLTSVWVCISIVAPVAHGAEVVVDFEDVGAGLAPESFYNGADGAGGFASGGVFFQNAFTDFGGGFTAWDGWSYSNVTDTTTPGFANQYAAFPGSGANGSATFAVAFAEDFGTTVNLRFAGVRDIVGVYLANSTYPALSMRDGDAFAKQFGGPTGDDPDFLRLTITGRDAAGAATGAVDSYLADYRFADNTRDFILDTWQWVDLSGLGGVGALELTLDSSDVGSFGINTPLYFALDGLTLPEPSAALLLALAVGVALRRRFALRALLPLLLVGVALDAGAGPFAASGVDAADVPRWATSVEELIRGPEDIADPTSPLASHGEPAAALGPADFGAVSLGDGGHITLSFFAPLIDGPGGDLAVFENGFGALGGVFAELAYVEVSSNGVDFARFQSMSLTSQPVDAFGTIDPTDVDGLAGQFPAIQGTPFDLADLVGDPAVSSGAVVLDAIRWVRLIDVIGDGSTTDSAGNPIYDPYPTAFASSGFDLDAVGALHVPEPVSLPYAVIVLVLGLGWLRAAARGS